MGLFGFGKKKEKKDPLGGFGSSGSGSLFGSDSDRNPFRDPPQRQQQSSFSQQGNGGNGFQDAQNSQGNNMFSQGNYDSSFGSNNNSFQSGFSGSGSDYEGNSMTPGSYGTDMQGYDQNYQQQGMSSSQGQPDMVMLNKNVEIMMSKLDAIRTAIENIEHRIDNLENSMGAKKSNDYRW
ncbi:MAG: hypothetical protein ACLFUO_00935 [Candidatus Woesearchaeota archaeon]